MASADILQPSFQAPTFSPVDGTASTKRKRAPDTNTSDLYDELISETPKRIQFEPSKHLNYVTPPETHTMEALGFANIGVSPIAVSEPFQLFTEEAVEQMRAEVLSKLVMENCQYSSNLAKAQLRGCAPEYAPFVYDVWRSPEVLKIISEIAKVELVPQMDFEIAHINLSVQSEEQKEETLKAIAEKVSRDADEGVSGCPWEDDQPIVDWHTDSYPFVCVTMLSDCTGMLGGETALRTGSGEIMRVRGPQKGSAVILQGRYIEHQALRALGTTERISMVTSFRPKSAFIKDDTVLTTVRAVSDLSELYSQYTEYRLEMLEERIRAHLKVIRERKRAHRRFDTAASKAFIAEQERFLAVMNREIVDEDKVVKGFTPSDDNLISADLKSRAQKRAKIAKK